MFHWAWKPQQFTHVTIHFYVVQNWFGPRFDRKDRNLYTALTYSLLFYNLHFTSYNVHFGSATFIEMKTNIENGRNKWKMFHMEEKKKDNYYEKNIGNESNSRPKLDVRLRAQQMRIFKKTSSLLAHNKIFMKCR